MRFEVPKPPLAVAYGCESRRFITSGNLFSGRFSKRILRIAAYSAGVCFVRGSFHDSFANPVEQ